MQTADCLWRTPLPCAWLKCLTPVRAERFVACDSATKQFFRVIICHDAPSECFVFFRSSGCLDCDPSNPLCCLVLIRAVLTALHASHPDRHAPPIESMLVPVGQADSLFAQKQ
eukprot:scaffold93926_cov17-Tisochrysis_lutea.AAC.2